MELTKDDIRTLNKIGFELKSIEIRLKSLTSLLYAVIRNRYKDASKQQVNKVVFLVISQLTGTFYCKQQSLTSLSRNKA